ncbi:hypothetical protein KUV80_02685 [Fictibacillus nanhaiensis]|uniref:SA1362 family protein n=1 Tax=Fictibacillus nanhaiensis TaxID=742169 RepID=UPI001C9409AE|nr:SA1362 family protein [Fictibacillus nanhaiensis]MBY6035535.1 hypothetical protein [Fictibacillus nanhaiensis]
MQQNSRRLHPIIWFVILLAVVGILNQLITSPSQLFKTLLIGAAVIAVFYFIFGRTSSGINGKYKKAVKQSKKRYGSNQKPAKTSPLFSSKKTKNAVQKKRAREHHLTVIEGKKNKKKNRASF